MSTQYQVKTGPITNAAAPFGAEMVQGYGPDGAADRRNTRFQFAKRVGWSIAQTTHDAATFQPNMVSDTRPPRNREFLPLRVGWRHWPPDVEAFSPDMVQGSHPDLPRIFFGPRIPLPVSQQTHVQAPFSADMVDGWTPDRNREFLPLRTGWAVSQPTHTNAPFSLEMVEGWIPGPRPIERGRAGFVGIAPDVQLFSVEMMQGWHPDRPNLLLAPRLPLPWSQTSHVNAPFGHEMVAGEKPFQPPKQDLRVKAGWLGHTPDVFAFSVEMVQGWHPDSPRAFLAPRLPLPWAQTSHVAAPLSSDMLQGAIAGRGRELVPLRHQQLHLPPDVVAAMNEMVQGSHPDAPRLFLAPLRSLQILPPEVLAAMNETVQGSHPDAPRLFLAPRLPLPWAQTTHVAAGISPEMMLGVRFIPSQYKALNDGLRIPPPDVQLVMVEHVQGWHPDSPRIRLAPRIPLPWSQTTHTPAAFSPEMAAGFKPDRYRELRPKFGWVVYQVVQAVGPAAIADITLLVSGDTRYILVPADPGVLLVSADPLSTTITGTDFIIVIPSDQGKVTS